MFCNACGAKNVDGAKFCNSCGARMVAVSAVAGAQSQPQMQGQAGPQMQSGSQAQPQMQRGSQAQPQMQRGPQAQPQMQSGPQPQPQMQSQSGPQPQPQMQRGPQVQPQPQMQSQSGPQSQPQNVQPVRAASGAKSSAPKSKLIIGVIEIIVIVIVILGFIAVNAISSDTGVYVYPGILGIFLMVTVLADGIRRVKQYFSLSAFDIAERSKNTSDAESLRKYVKVMRENDGFDKERFRQQADDVLAEIAGKSADPAQYGKEAALLQKDIYQILTQGIPQRDVGSFIQAYLKEKNAGKLTRDKGKIKAASGNAASVIVLTFETIRILYETACSKGSIGNDNKMILSSQLSELSAWIKQLEEREWPQAGQIDSYLAALS